MLIVNAEVEGQSRQHVRLEGERITTIGPDLMPLPGEALIDARGGVLLPGLHDHHLHLFALTAQRHSLNCGPPQVNTKQELHQALGNAPGQNWIRGIGYHESVAGPLDRHSLDALCTERPLRIQHRSGKMWFLNSLAIAQLALNAGSDGRLFRQDEWLRGRLPTDPDFLQQVQTTAHWLAGFGLTGLTDATPANNHDTQQLFQTLALPQHVLLMGDETVGSGPLKVMLDDCALPDLETFRQRLQAAHQQGRNVAVHCVTRTELVLTVATFLDAGTLPGDRIEHASVTDDATMELIVQAGLTVVTQPNFIAERGDQYLSDVDVADWDALYRCRGFLDAGVPLGGGTDAPFGRPDPWSTMRAAVRRETASGQIINRGEALTPEQALALFTTAPELPGGEPRRITVGSSADLCLLDRPWREARLRLVADDVATTIIKGDVAYSAGDVSPASSALTTRRNSLPVSL